MSRERTRRRISTPEPSEAIIPKLPYFERYRVEQVIDPDELKDKIKVSPQTVHKVTETSVRRSISYILKWDGNYWVKDYLDYKNLPLKFNGAGGQIAAGSFNTAVLGNKGQSGLIESLGIFFDNKEGEVIIKIDNVAQIFLSIPTVPADVYSPERLFKVGGEDRYLKLVQYDVVNDLYNIINKCDIKFMDGCEITLFNPTAGIINFNNFIYFRGGL